jgi:hypothetical protein
MPIELLPFRETPYNLQFIFAGKMFAWEYRAAFAPGTTNFQFKTQASQDVHFITRSITTGSTAINVQLIENPALTDGTTLLSVYNVNRAAGTTATMAIYSNPAAIVGGSTLENIQLVQSVTLTQPSPELILKRSEDYILRVVNSGAAPAPYVDLKYVWYESSN